MQARVATIRQRLDSLGWSEGRNLRIDIRFAEADPGRHVSLARALVALRPDAIIAYSTPIASALRRESSTIPIVFVNVSDPIGSGLVASLARPNSNVTGLMLYEEGISGKWLAMLKEIAPQLTRAALIANPKSTPFDYFVRSAKVAASSLGVEVVPSPIENAADIEHVIASLAQSPHGGLVVLPDSTSIQHRDLVVALAARHRLPAVYAFRFWVVAGGLMSYGTEDLEQYREAASYVDRILRGAKPAELPVQAPTKYETILNLKTGSRLASRYRRRFWCPPTRSSNEEARVPHAARRRSSHVAARGARAAAGDAGDRVTRQQVGRGGHRPTARISPRLERSRLCRGRERSDRLPLGREST
jgi:putative tryptophan/tyrosine transport system substrate-binding protein